MAASLTGAPFAGAPRRRRRRLAPAQRWSCRSGTATACSCTCRSRSSALPQDAQLGFNTVRTEAGEWRVFSTLAGDQVVQVAQPMSARRELAASMALRTVVPLLLVAAGARAA